MATFSRDNQSYTSDYAGNTGYQDLFNNYVNYLGGIHSDSGQARQNLIQHLDSVVGDFSSQFTNLVGRAPTQDELSHFTQNNLGQIIDQAGGITKNDPTSTNNGITQYVSQNYQKAAQDYATQQLQGQTGQANDLANLFRKQGTDAINQTEQSLLDYQSKLFDKLRPNLITSLQAQGLLDTGGLNEAMAGKQADLANSASGYLADARLQNEQQANQIAFSGASAPYQYQQSNILNQVPQLQAAGQNALGMNYNTFLTNLNYQNQLGLQANAAHLQNDMQPSFLRTLSQGFASSLGSLGGQAAGQGLNSSLFGSKQGMPGMSSAGSAPAYAAIA